MPRQVLECGGIPPLFRRRAIFRNATGLPFPIPHSALHTPNLAHPAINF
jgi:hypothetical protein